MTAPLRHPILSRTDATVLPLAQAPTGVREWLLSRSETTVFQTPAWMSAVERGTGHEALMATVLRDGEPVAALSLTFARSRLFGRALVGSGFAVDGGAVIADDEAGEALSHAVRSFAIDQSVGIELRGGAALPEFGEAPPTHVTFSKEIAGDRDTLLKAIPRKQRAEVRKSFDRELTIRHGTEAGQRAAHYAVYATSVRNLGTPVFARSLFDAVLDEPGLDSDITVVRSRDGRPLSAVLTLFHRGVAMPYWGGGTHEARAERANEAMYFALMERAVERGCDHFDFGRSKVESGPASFKKNWGFEARPVQGFHWTPPGVSPRDVDSTSDANAWKTRAWQRLPLAVANRLGPPIARGLA